MKKIKAFVSKFYILLCFVFFYLPIVVTMVFSFNESKSLTHFTGFSMKWYQALLTDNEVMAAVYVSVTIAILATVISTILGTVTAIGLSKSNKLLKDCLLNLNQIPILNPEIVTAIGLMLLFSSFGFTKGYGTMLLAHIAFCTPYVITSVYPKVRGLDPNLANAAMDLGATPAQAVIKVILPMLRPGIFAGALLAFTMSFDDFVISYFVSGNGVKNISIVVYNMTKRINPTINALSTIVIVVIVVILLITNVLPMLRKGKGLGWVSKVISAVLVVALAGGCFALWRTGAGKITATERNLKVYNAGEYIDTDLLTEFQELYDCNIIYETFESNEMMYTKVSSGEVYDVLIPSDYMIERLILEDWLQPLDWTLIENKNELMPNVMNGVYDPGNVYSVPYFWGTVGILYDTTKVASEDVSEGWDLLMNTRYAGNIYMYDSERDAFMPALKALGYSMNTTNPDEINDAYEWLMRQRREMAPIYAGDDVIDNMISGNKAMAVIYSGDAAYIMSENEDMAYLTPDQGTNIWCDAMVIPKTATEVELAHAFIDFMTSPEAATKNTSAVGYTSPVTEAFETMKAEEYADIDAYVPRMDGEKDETFRHQEMETKSLFAELWTKVKAN